MKKEGCQCFTCRHSDEPRVVAGYLNGYIDACEMFLKWAKENGVKMGSIIDTDLGGLYAIIQCNYDDSRCLLSCMPDLEVDGGCNVEGK